MRISGKAPPPPVTQAYKQEVPQAPPFHGAWGIGSGEWSVLEKQRKFRKQIPCSLSGFIPPHNAHSGVLQNHSLS